MVHVWLKKSHFHRKITYFLTPMSILFLLQFGMFECLTSGFIDVFPKTLMRRKSLFTALLCAVQLLLGLPLVTKVKRHGNEPMVMDDWVKMWPWVFMFVRSSYAWDVWIGWFYILNPNWVLANCMCSQPRGDGIRFVTPMSPHLHGYTIFTHLELNGNPVIPVFCDTWPTQCRLYHIRLDL